MSDLAVEISSDGFHEVAYGGMRVFGTDAIGSLVSNGVEVVSLHEAVSDDTAKDIGSRILWDALSADSDN